MMNALASLIRSPASFLESGFQPLSARLNPAPANRADNANAGRGLAVVESRVAAKLGTSTQVAQASESGERRGPDRVAANILGFVANRLRSEAAEGASEERLESLLSQAREGVRQGFAEAREQLGRAGLLNDRLSDEIDQSLGRVNAGLDGLEAEFLSVPDTEPANTGSSPGGVSREAGIAFESRSRESLRFEVVTREGDRVQVAFDSRQRSSGALFAAQGEAGSVVAASQSFSSASRFSFSVEGALSETELADIKELVGEVDDLAGRFFGGDVQGAFQQALDLGLDGESLAQFSLNLNFTRTTQVSAYSRVAEQPSPADRLQPAARLGRDIAAAQARENPAGLARGSVQSLLETLLADRRERQLENGPQPAARLGEDFIRALSQPAAQT